MKDYKKIVTVGYFYAVYSHDSRFKGMPGYIVQSLSPATPLVYPSPIHGGTSVINFLFTYPEVLYASVCRGMHVHRHTLRHTKAIHILCIVFFLIHLGDSLCSTITERVSIFLQWQSISLYGFHCTLCNHSSLHVYFGYFHFFFFVLLQTLFTCRVKPYMQTHQRRKFVLL